MNVASFAHKSGVTREEVDSLQRRRLCRAMLELLTERRTVKKVSVHDVLKRSGVGRRQFYGLFVNKHECAYVALELQREERRIHKHQAVAVGVKPRASGG